MLDYRSTLVAAGAFMGTLFVGCGDPDLPTDLRTSGPPNVTAVTVMTDLKTAIDPDGPLERFVEDATFCRLNDDKRPGLVGLDAESTTLQVCPVDLAMKAMDEGVAPAAPPAWFLRIVFDKLLDPSIEDLEPVLDESGMPTGMVFGTLKNTQPVTLRCNDVEIAYDGHYVPNGNKESWPLGPNLTIQPLTPTDAPTGATCTVSIRDNVHNKSGQPVPPEQRSYTFKLAPMSFRFSNPDLDEKQVAGEIGLDPRNPIELFFSAELKVTGKLGNLLLSDLDLSKVKLISAPNVDGKPDANVCKGNGTAVDPAQIRAYLRGVNATTEALVLRLDAGGTIDPTHPDQVKQSWLPNTTYQLTFLDGAAVTPKQGGDAGALPGASDFSLCFHTTDLPSN